MAIVLKNSRFNLSIDSKTIIGVMGKDYDKFLKSLNGDDVFYLDKKTIIIGKKVIDLLGNFDINVLEDFNLTKDFINKEIMDLSHSEQRLLKYILLVISDKKIIVIDEPFMDLDYENKKRIILLLNRLKKNKTIIIGSIDSNIIYPICKKILFINNNEYYYGDAIDFSNKDLLKKYHIAMPDLVKFVLLANTKNKKIKYSKDIRDLIKDVYRNVSKKQN